MSLRKKFSIRELPEQVAGKLAPFLSEIKRAIQGLSDDAVGRDELIATGLVQVRNGSLVPHVPGEESTSITPPMPTGVTVTEAVGAIMIEFDGFRYVGHAYAEILRGSSNDYGAAFVIGSSPHSLYVDAVGIDSPGYYYWVRFVSKAGRAGPPDSMAGTPASTNLVNTSELVNGSVTNSKIANLSVDNAKIISMTAAKITAGSIAVGEYVQSTNYVAGTSGWKISGNGFAELSGILVRGTVYASAGTIGGNTIDASGIESPGFSSTSGFRLDSSGVLRAYGYSGTRVIDMSAVGVSPAIKFGSAFEVRGDGTAMFSGALSAATGTFSGALAGATGSFAGSLSAATGSFAGSLSAATGSFAGVLTASAVNAVDTINIAGEAVVVPRFAESSSGYYLTADFSSILSSTVINVGSSPVCIMITAQIYSMTSEGYDNITLRLLRNGYEIRNWVVVGAFSATLSDTPGGSAYYTLEGKSVYGSFVLSRSMLLLGVKR